MDGDDGVQAVILAREQRLGFQAFDLLAEGVEVAAQFARDVLALVRKLQVGFEVRQLAREFLVRFERLL